MYLITTSLRIPIKSEVDSLKDRFSSSWYIRQYAQADNGHVYTAGKEREGGEIGPARERQKQGLSSYCREYKTPVPPLTDSVTLHKSPGLFPSLLQQNENFYRSIAPGGCVQSCAKRTASFSGL